MGRTLKARRRTAGLTQRDLARSAGVPLGTIRDIEQGRTGQPQRRTIARLSHILEIDEQDLAAFQDGMVKPLWIQVLGPVSLRRQGSVEPLGPPQQRAVFALLALHVNQLVHRDEIVDCLWPQSPPSSAVNLVQGYVAKLRRRLGSDKPTLDFSGSLSTSGLTYRLALDGGQIDLIAFEERSEVAQQLQKNGQELRACEAYEEALGLWRGRPAKDIPVVESHPSAVGLTRQWTEAIFRYAGATIAAGHPELCVQELWQLCEREPLDERAHLMLMQVLTATNQHAVALQIFEDLRVRLDLELGTNPGHALSALHQKILRHEPTSDRDQRPVIRVSNVPLWTPICQLPPDVADFTGRRDECRRLIELLRPQITATAPQTVVVSGPPGVGKSALALHVAHGLRESFPDGQLYVQLSGASRPRDPADILGELLRALRLPPGAIPQSLDERAARLRALLADKRILLVMDDAYAVEQLLPLQPSTPGCAVLITSRQRMTGLAGARLLPIDSMAESDAIEMLARIVGAERAAEEPHEAIELVRYCGMFPLAIRIAGARLAAQPAWRLSRLITLLGDRSERLNTLTLDHLEVRASIGSSFEALAPAARDALLYLSLLGPNDFAEWVLIPLLLNSNSAALVDMLVRCSLLSPVGLDATGEPRYRLHDLIRDFAEEALTTQPETLRKKAVHRMALTYLDLAERAAALLPVEPHFQAPTTEAREPNRLLPDSMASRLIAEPVAWFDAERMILMAMVRRAVAAGDLWLAERLAQAHLSYHHAQARLGEMMDVWRLLLDAAQEQGDGQVAARARYRLATATSWAGDYHTASSMLDECIAEFQELSDNPNLLLALVWRGYAAYIMGDYDDALVHVRRGLELSRQENDPRSEIMNLRMIGVSLARLDDVEGIAVSLEALTMATSLDDPLYVYLACNGAAWAAAHFRKYALVVEVCEQGLRAIAQAGLHEATAAYFLSLLGDCRIAEGKYEEALQILRSTESMFRARGDRRALAHCLMKIGHAQRALGLPFIEQFLESEEILIDLGLNHIAVEVTKELPGEL